MKQKVFSALLVVVLAVLSMGAAKESSEIQRMGIFISNFTEQGLYNFDLEEDGDENILHLGNPDNVGDLIRFGIAHNIINNPKSTLKKCTRKNCEYGPNIMSAKDVSRAVEKYFAIPDLEHQSVMGYSPEAYFDGKNYHFNPKQWGEDKIYYAEVQEVSRGKRVITMEGELYNLKRKSERPAFFRATAKPYKWAGKNTWSILSLKVNWKDEIPIDTEE